MERRNRGKGKQKVSKEQQMWTHEGNICMCAEHSRGQREGPTQDSESEAGILWGLLSICEADI